MIAACVTLATVVGVTVVLVCATIIAWAVLTVQIDKVLRELESSKS